MAERALSSSISPSLSALPPLVLCSIALCLRFALRGPQKAEGRKEGGLRPEVGGEACDSKSEVGCFGCQQLAGQHSRQQHECAGLRSSEGPHWPFARRNAEEGCRVRGGSLMRRRCSLTHLSARQGLHGVQMDALEP